MNILIVDDSAATRQLYQTYLEKAGYARLYTAESAQKALEILQVENSSPDLPAEIDLILMDIEMPDINGIEACRRVKANDRLGDIPVIMVTSRTGAKHRALAKEAGCSAYMGKPFNFPALVEQISKLTGHDLQLS